MATLTDLSRPLVVPDWGTSTDEKKQREWQLWLTKMSKYAYWVIGLGLVVTICYLLYNTYSRPVASILIFVGSILALYFYYIKWFFIDSSTKWPTGSSLCPDYLTPVSPGFQTNFDGSVKPDANGEFKCVDFVGVSTNGALRKATPSNMQLALMDPNYHIVISPKASHAEIKSMLIAKGLSWLAMFGDIN
jgi:hypothetical protein